MAGDFDGGRASVAAAFAALPSEPFMPPHWGEMVAVLQLELCRGGGGARQWLAEHQLRHQRATYLRQAVPRTRLLLFRANAALAACRDADTAAVEAMLREVGQSATQLEALGQGGDVLRLRAQLAALTGDQEAAFGQIRAVRGATEHAGLVAVSRAELYVEGFVEGGETGAAERRDALRRFFGRRAGAIRCARSLACVRRLTSYMRAADACVVFRGCRVRSSVTRSETSARRRQAPSPRFSRRRGQLSQQPACEESNAVRGRLVVLRLSRVSARSRRIAASTRSSSPNWRAKVAASSTPIRSRSNPSAA